MRRFGAVFCCWRYLQVGDDGRVTPVMKVKLSIAGDAPDKGVQQVGGTRHGHTCHQYKGHT